MMAFSSLVKIIGLRKRPDDPLGGGCAGRFATCILLRSLDTHVSGQLVVGVRSPFVFDVSLLLLFSSPPQSCPLLT